MPKLFELNDSNPNDENADSITLNFYKIHLERIDSLKSLVNIPSNKEVSFLWSRNSFNAFTFIPFCIAHYETIDELFLSTYSINMRIVNALLKQVDKGKIGCVHILISDSFRFRQSPVHKHLDAMLSSRPQVSVSYGWNHSKVTCAKCGDNHFVFEGSGNWSENAMFEQYVLTNTKEIYEFRKKNILDAG